jgi:hypothetical protein
VASQWFFRPHSSLSHGLFYPVSACLFAVMNHKDGIWVWWLLKKACFLDYIPLTDHIFWANIYKSYFDSTNRASHLKVYPSVGRFTMVFCCECWPHSSLSSWIIYISLSPCLFAVMNHKDGIWVRLLLKKASFLDYASWTDHIFWANMCNFEMKSNWIFVHAFGADCYLLCHVISIEKMNAIPVCCYESTRTVSE